VQILSARDEARLGVDAALASLSFNNGLVIDLGGASLRSAGSPRKVVSTASLSLGPSGPRAVLFARSAHAARAASASP